jgi:hypothetical protein
MTASQHTPRQANDDSHVWAGSPPTSTCARHGETVRKAELTAHAKPLT